MAASIDSIDTDRFRVVNERLYTAVLGDILDALGYYRQFLPPQIRPMLPGMRVAGRAMPVLVDDVSAPQPKPFGLLTEALDALNPGEVYIASGATVPAATWGEILTATAQSRGSVGAVVDGYHRDTVKVLEQQFPVFSTGPYAQDSSPRTLVRDFGVPIEIGGVSVRPGDLVVGDIDGVLVIPRELEDEVIARALDKASAESLVRLAIQGGMSATEAFATHGVL